MARIYTSVILDSIDTSEYLALSSTNKEVLKMIISAGVVSFDADSPTYQRLNIMFPVGSTTWNNLLSNRYKDRETTSSN